MLLLVACSTAKPSSQNPSPMVDWARAHERVQPVPTTGTRFGLSGVLAKPIDVLINVAAESSDAPDLLIHFHGSSFVPVQAVASLDRPVVVAVINLGSGGALFDRSFRDPAVFPSVVDAVQAAVRQRVKRPVTFAHRYLSGFSAGYGAIRAILRNDPAAIDGVLLLDGLHTGYVPERRPLAAGGKLDEVPMDPFHRYASMAAAGRKRLIITHSEIFPGTFASTTETTDDLLRHLGLQRTAVLRWGPGGMQQLSETRRSGLLILGFAGNSAPDHVDHLHGMAAFIPLLWSSPPD